MHNNRCRGPSITAHGSLDLKQEIHLLIQIQIVVVGSAITVIVVIVIIGAVSMISHF
jgi:hypothetical protein